MLRFLVPGFLLSIAVFVADAEPPPDVEVFNCIRNIQMKYADMEETDFRTAKQQFRAMIGETARGINLAELTPYQAVLIGPMLESGELSEDQHAALNTALERAANDVDHGAAALLILHSLNYWEDPERTYLARFFEHPNLEVTMNGWFGPDAINSFGLGPKDMRRFGDSVERAILAINPNGCSRRPNRAAVARLFEALDHPDIATETKARRKRIHDHLLKIARSSLSRMAPNGGSSYEPNARQIESAIDLVEYLEGPASRSELVGHTAPELEFAWSRGPDATFAKLSDLKGKVIVIDFWATWCGPCVASFPNVRELQTHYAGKDVVIIGVTSIQGYHVPIGGDVVMLKDKPDREMELMAEYMGKNDVTWNVAFSTRSVMDPRYDVRGIPNLTIIDRNGRVRYTGLHPSGTPFEEKVRMIDELLNETN